MFFIANSEETDYQKMLQREPDLCLPCLLFKEPVSEFPVKSGNKLGATRAK